MELFGRAPKILFTSTSEVYGDPLESPQKEDYRGNVNPHGLRSCYDEGKRVAESLCMNYWRKYEMPMKIVRIFNTYGPFMDPDDGRAVSNFITRALKGKNLDIYGDGKQTRSFQYIDDLIEGLIAYMNLEEDFPGPINLGNPNEISILELAEKVIEMTGADVEMDFCDLPDDDPMQRCPEISLAKKKLGWMPGIDLETGLKKTIEYFRSIV
jgi:UDP-glucuronate decarboxylase